MRSLWGTNWVFISQKATFFIVTAVKTSNLAKFEGITTFLTVISGQTVKRGFLSHNNNSYVNWPDSSSRSIVLASTQLLTETITVRLTPRPSVSRLSRERGSPELSQPHGPPRLLHYLQYMEQNINRANAIGLAMKLFLVESRGMDNAWTEMRTEFLPNSNVELQTWTSAVCMMWLLRTGGIPNPLRSRSHVCGHCVAFCGAACALGAIVAMWASASPSLRMRGAMPPVPQCM
jgi:hypothetical protein